MKKLICGRHGQTLEETETAICAVPVEVTFSKIVQDLVDNLRQELVAEVRSVRDIVSAQPSTSAVVRTRCVDVQTEHCDPVMPKVHSKGLSEPPLGLTYTESSPTLMPRQLQETKAMALPSPCRTCRKTSKLGVVEKELPMNEPSIPSDQIRSLREEITKLKDIRADFSAFQARAIDGIVAGVCQAAKAQTRKQEFDALDAELAAHCQVDCRRDTVEPDARRRAVGGPPVAALRGQWTMTEEVRRLHDEMRRMFATPSTSSNPAHSTDSTSDQHSELVHAITESRREFRDLAMIVRGLQVTQPKVASARVDSMELHEQHGLLLRDIKDSQQTLRELAIDAQSQRDGVAAEFGDELRKLVSASEEALAHKLLAEDIQKRQSELQQTMTEEFRKVRSAIGAGLAALSASGVASPVLRPHLDGCAIPTPPSKLMPRASPPCERPTPGSDRLLHRV